MALHYSQWKEGREGGKEEGKNLGAKVDAICRIMRKPFLEGCFLSNCTQAV